MLLLLGGLKWIVIVVGTIVIIFKAIPLFSDVSKSIREKKRVIIPGQQTRLSLSKRTGLPPFESVFPSVRSAPRIVFFVKKLLDGCDGAGRREKGGCPPRQGEGGKALPPRAVSALDDLPAGKSPVRWVMGFSS